MPPLVPSRSSPLARKIECPSHPSRKFSSHDAVHRFHSPPDRWFTADGMETGRLVACLLERHSAPPAAHVKTTQPISKFQGQQEVLINPRRMSVEIVVIKNNGIHNC
ncbi:uncharacterized protein LOC144207819 [Stigmatopora nigra]